MTVLQFAEGLSDRQAAEAVRARINWKYLLGLELGDPGFHYSVRCEFRGRLVGGAGEVLLLDRLLDVCRAPTLLRATGKQRTDSTHVLGALANACAARLFLHQWYVVGHRCSRRHGV